MLEPALDEILNITPDNLLNLVENYIYVDTTRYLHEIAAGDRRIKITGVERVISGIEIKAREYTPNILHPGCRSRNDLTNFDNRVYAAYRAALMRQNAGLDLDMPLLRSSHSRTFGAILQIRLWPLTNQSTRVRIAPQNQTQQLIADEFIKYLADLGLISEDKKQSKPVSKGRPKRVREVSEEDEKLVHKIIAKYKNGGVPIKKICDLEGMPYETFNSIRRKLELPQPSTDQLTP